MYDVTKQFPASEKYGLSSQIQRAAISIPSNIAEGLMRITQKEFRKHIGIARGSLGELITQLQLAEDFGYLDKQTAKKIKEDSIEIAKILYAIIGTISKNL